MTSSFINVESKTLSFVSSQSWWTSPLKWKTVPSRLLSRVRDRNKLYLFSSSVSSRFSDAYVRASIQMIWVCVSIFQSLNKCCKIAHIWKELEGSVTAGLVKVSVVAYYKELKESKCKYMPDFTRAWKKNPQRKKEGESEGGMEAEYTTAFLDFCLQT